MMRFPPKGLIIALVTPFDEGGMIDWPSLKNLVERALPFADGLLVGEGLIGEGLSLPNQRRLELLKGSLELVSGRKPLLLCPTANTQEETLANVVTVAKDYPGHPGEESLFWVDIPLWYHSNRKLSQLYQEWSRCTLFPIFLYNNPQLIFRLNRSLKRTNIRTAVLKSLSENEQIAGLIQLGDLKRTIHYQRAVRARRDFRFYDGDERSFLNQPSSSGVVSWGANLLPADWKEVVDASLNLSEDAARNLVLWEKSQKLRELSQALRRNPAMGIKFTLQRLGIISRAGVLEGKGSAYAASEEAMGVFLREKFSLLFPS